jgi:prephenate dehydratase
MKEIIIGIQGDRGSTNERACIFFAKKHGFKKYKIEYLISTENVLRALNKGEIDYGTFAWESSRAGLVEETQEAIKKYKYKKIDEERFQLDHALLYKIPVDKTKIVNIFSHPQALKEHEVFIKREFPKIKLLAEVDTAIAAKKLHDGEYPGNSIVIAPIACANIYNLNIYLADIPTNKGYLTTIYLVKH